MSRNGFGIVISAAGRLESDHHFLIDPEGTAAQYWRPLDTRD
jgi:hypothetical protein